MIWMLDVGTVIQAPHWLLDVMVGLQAKHTLFYLVPPIYNFQTLMQKGLSLLAEYQFNTRFKQLPLWVVVMFYKAATTQQARYLDSALYKDSSKTYFFSG